ncbi:Uncharacterized protein FWK35_00025936 [Aphis craccivora]|uniref:Uncharacterized protein n=1 Tax=Aphis craccivora TaxID=307492 RepID=A0A6G0VUZ4_APHCR|nr:Uncharacterized protein FWK35_00025936 [Aphis craccivora]
MRKFARLNLLFNFEFRTIVDTSKLLKKKIDLSEYICPRSPFKKKKNIKIANSERSEECIDFTMMCVFFFASVYSITSRNNAPISNFGGGFRCKGEYPWCIIEVKS